MERLVSKSKFKPQALEYFRKIEESGEDLIITDHGRPVLKIVAYTPKSPEGLQALRNSVLKFEAPTEPVGLEEWAVLN